jgi:hypothetical protein
MALGYMKNTEKFGITLYSHEMGKCGGLSSEGGFPHQGGREGMFGFKRVKFS